MAAKIEVFDPPMCCSSGVCGPNINKALPKFAADLDWLKFKGVTVERYNLARDLRAFASNATVKGMLAEKGEGCLPVILADGKVVSQGAYPTRPQLATYAGVDAADAKAAHPAPSCCGEAGCCTPKRRPQEKARANAC